MNIVSWQIICGGLATLGIYSFLIKENPLYRFFEHLFIGIAAGFVPLLTIKTFLIPNIIIPLVYGNVMKFPDGTTAGEYQPLYLFYILPLLFGLLYYTIYIPRFSFGAKLVIGFGLGASAALSLKGFFSEMLPQLRSSFKPLIVFSDGKLQILESINNTLFIFTLLSVMFYFFFSFKQSSSFSRKISASGRYLMMICFGAFFGSTIMARMALLVERLDFLTWSFLPTIAHLF
jgi:hypothetical protein